MKYRKKSIKSYYLSLSCKLLINNELIHSILFFLEMITILFELMEFYVNNYDFINNENPIIFNPMTSLLIFSFNLLPDIIKFIIYIIIISIPIVTYFVVNYLRLKINTLMKVMVNLTELFFYRLLSFSIFDFLFLFNNIFFLVNIILTFIFILILILNFYKNNLNFFFPYLISYPYDQFSKVIDLHLLAIKIILSLAGLSMTNVNATKFFFITSIFVLFILLFYLTYILKQKSYYLLNNCKLNKIRYAIILSFCIIVILMLIIGKKDLFNIFYLICYFNVFDICLFLVLYFYDPYEYAKFDKDDNIENIYYYFFILDRNKNQKLLLEEKIEEHLSKCNKCNLCKKYNNIKMKNEENIDLYYIISDGKHIEYNLLNSIIRNIKKNGSKSFNNNSYYLINLIYIYNICSNLKEYNLLLNIDLLFEIINFENNTFLEEYTISLNQLLYANNFCVKANNIINAFCELFEEKNIQKKTKCFMKLAELLNDLKYKEIKSNVNNNANAIEGLPNCNNLLVICSLFYEELFNESVSNSGIYIRESPNLIEDLVNNNNKSLKQITLEINISKLNMKIIRAGGLMNKYENSYLFDIFPSIFKNRQKIEMKNLLLHSNEDFHTNLGKNNKNKKEKEKKKNYINFNFIIQENEDNIIFYRYLKLKLNYIFLPHISLIIYLNGVYAIDKDIITTEKIGNEEIILHFGNKKQMDNSIIKNNIYNNNVIINKGKNGNYLGNKKLIKDSNIFTDCKKYSVYHLLLNNTKKDDNERFITRKRKYSHVNSSEEKNNSFEEKKDLYIFNDIASQSSSCQSTISKNHFVYNNKSNKKNENGDNLLKQFNFTKFALYLSLIIFFIFIIIMSYRLLGFHSELYKSHNYFLLFYDYSCNFEILFFSIISLTCIANSINSTICTNYINSLTETVKIYDNISVSIDFSGNSVSLNFVNFTELFFSQNEILYESLNNKLDEIIQYLSLINYNDFAFMKDVNENILHYKINKISQIDGDIQFILSKENINFLDFLLLMTSRFGIIINNDNSINSPVYILNKTGDEALNNIYNKDKLNSFQENIYLLILDYKNFVEIINFFISHVKIIASENNVKLKQFAFLFISLYLLFVIIILISILLFVNLYLIVIFQIMDNICNNLKERSGDITIKDIFVQKINNLKLILMVYENDINITMENINKIYGEFRDIYNAKLKEESKLMKTSTKFETNNKKHKYGLRELISIYKKLNLYKYSKRQREYFLTLLFIIIISLSVYTINLILWIFIFKEERTISNWVDISVDFVSTSEQLMNNFLLTVINNQTLEDLSSTVENKDYLMYVFNKLTYLYKGDKYFNRLGNIDSLNDRNIIYDCNLYYKNLENELFEKLKKKFINEEKKFYNTIIFFCEWSGVMIFKKYKTIFLVLFNKIKIYMESLNSYEYNDIIQYILKNEIVKVEIIYLITDIYLLQVANNNIEIFILGILNKMKKRIIFTTISLLIVLIIFIISILFIYIRNVNADCKKFILIKKVFKVCNVNE